MKWLVVKAFCLSTDDVYRTVDSLYYDMVVSRDSVTLHTLDISKHMRLFADCLYIDIVS
jgi:hypothetical protein